jgi:membrane-associated protease RseP (regulator of RpoE activity)
VGIYGGVLFVFALLLSIVLHEAGHMVCARKSGGKVTEFFVGFGPKLWSFRRGETEYGVKAIPAGGYVKIIGMTDLEPVDEEDLPRAFYTKPLKNRLVTLAAGSMVHFLIALFLFALIPMTLGDTKQVQAATVGTVGECLSPDVTNPCDPKTATPSPAKAWGLVAGDTITSVGSTPVTSWQSLTDTLHALPAGKPTTLTVVHKNGQSETRPITPGTTQGYDTDGKTKKDFTAIGIQPSYEVVRKNPIAAVGEGFTTWGSTAKASVVGLIDIPKSIPKLFQSTTSDKPRSADSPVGVVGMTTLSGGVIEHNGYAGFLGFVASINLFIGIFNLLPILPLDGGHIAIALYEAVRSKVARKRRLPDPGRVDLNKMMPVAFTFLALFVGLSLLLIAADITNPLKFPG